MNTGREESRLGGVETKLGEVERRKDDLQHDPHPSQDLLGFQRNRGGGDVDIAECKDGLGQRLRALQRRLGIVVPNI